VLASKDLSFEVGQPVWLRFKPDKVHFFDRETGNLLA